MKLFAVLMICLMFSGCEAQQVESKAFNQNNPKSENQKSKVLVELFTSEGCSSCPPADRALAFLQKEQPNSQAEIITLAFHVNYWDNLGWKDEFSSQIFTERQQFYGRKFNLSSIYTPQMIIDGSSEAVGSNLGKVQQKITEAVNSAKANLMISTSENKVSVKITEIPPHQNSIVYLAIAENNLNSSVKAGENAGNNLEHISVVRELKVIGKLKKTDDSFDDIVNFSIEPFWKKKDLKVVVFVQDTQTGKIIGSNWESIN
ncbi:MAG: DUF1223 domain-containing protein [Pyrinomonadaceae bacterium]|nr:DUF1223 domain-containing protein [Pyrinomonadaceae bacterium]